MYTGCIDHYGRLVHIEKKSLGSKFHIETTYDDIRVGESLAINGICLTVVAVANQQFSCDLSPETLMLTNASFLNVGSLVNLERSLRVSDRLNGHFVMGHVDQTCQLSSKELTGDYLKCRFSGLLPDALAFVIKKGSIAINGVSLTINDVIGEMFEVMLIPETLKRTNLHTLELNDIVNIEYDYLAKLIANQVVQNRLVP